ncbi:hypothetical protein PICMEDRAFT_23558, partial [Pichia membranifaciens NRRL Y-2026]
PAWKRLGLKVKAVVGKDPLAIVTQREEGEDKTERKDKKQGKRKAEDGARARPAKAAKRVKLPRQERLQKQRQSAEEKDQLQYLRQFDEDREHWKFSKQKQNWLVKNIRHVPESCEGALLRYLESVQGGSRQRVADAMAAVVQTWNTMVDEAEDQMRRDLAAAAAETPDKPAGANGSSGDKPDKPKKQPDHASETPPDYDYAVRAREVLRVLTGETLFLK